MTTTSIYILGQSSSIDNPMIGADVDYFKRLPSDTRTSLDLYRFLLYIAEAINQNHLPPAIKIFKTKKPKTKVIVETPPNKKIILFPGNHSKHKRFVFNHKNCGKTFLSLL